MMIFTPYHAKYCAYELTKRVSSDSLEKFASALVDAQVDLNPHQVEAALFAFKSPLSKGALLADEVGLGKTIEAGLVISQKWAERKRRILIITPSNLRKQWYQEMQEKFFLPCEILETKNYNALVTKGEGRPFEPVDKIVICSYQFAKNKSIELSQTKWDLVVIDEAHRLRNVYKPSNVIANTLKESLREFKILLLTATPLQNSLLELYGLVSFIDEHAFGDLKSFREQYAYINDQNVFNTLRSRLKPICHRTLRRQVTNYVKYTKRHPLVQPFTPEDGEDKLYHLVSEYLRRDNLQALPNSQRSLMTLVLRKLLASSTFAIAGALESLRNRLQARVKKEDERASLEEVLEQDYESLSETVEEWNTEDGEIVEPLTEQARLALEQEIKDLDEFYNLAVSIKQNAKGKALVIALRHAFAEAKRLGAKKKAIIFTESRRTQLYLLRVLTDSEFADGVVLFNGSNTDKGSRTIYKKWMERHQGTDKITGSRTADMRSALVDYFREEGNIMIATEAGAEGINLQFCSLVVNYDLPWNPQRIEQRIGRCHRYGQEYDVVVVNFLNQKNEADQRVFELLSEKFKLFEGVFGTSDEVLGAIESGVDFEKRIVAIYQKCRTSGEIKTSFDQLQLELFAQINDAMMKTRQQLIDNFDEEVHEKLRVSMQSSREYRTRGEQMLMSISKHILGEHAAFKADDSSFHLKKNPFNGLYGDIPLGEYELPRRTGEAHLYRLNHPLALNVLDKAKNCELPTAEIVFDWSNHKPKISPLEGFVGKTGELTLSLFTVESLDQAEDYLVWSGISENGDLLDDEASMRLFSLEAKSVTSIDRLSFGVELGKVSERRKSEIQNAISERNANFFEIEAEKLEGWAEDLKLALERDIKEVDKQLKEAKRNATLALSLEEKLAGQKQIKALELQRNDKRRSLFDAQDQVDIRREQLIEEIEGKLKQTHSTKELFTFRWKIV